MELSVYNIKGEDTGRKVQLNDDIYGIEPNEHVMYLAVRQYLADQRQGTHKSKERSELSGSTRKLFRQKGTGGARRGDIKGITIRCQISFEGSVLPVYIQQTENIFP